ncbi:DUF502 domain-containing protein [Candidatus Dependentiae bacterium]|nr:DUF502 domain-containing protein [Candidatus Dependentiae bacterium]
MKCRNFVTRFFENIRSIFLNGLLTILPITITVALFRFSFKLIKSWLQPVYNFEPTYLKSIPHSEILLVIAFIFLIGFILKYFILEHIIHAIERILARVPLLSKVYAGVKQLINTITGKDPATNVQNIVFVEFPRIGIYSLGFVTGEIAKEIVPNIQEKIYSIFIPTSPNPTTGFYIACREKDFFVVNMTKQEAIAIIISGGIISPERRKSE